MQGKANHQQSLLLNSVPPSFDVSPATAMHMPLLD